MGNARKKTYQKVEPSDWYWLYGLHAVEAALLNHNRHRGELLATRNAAMRLQDVFEQTSIKPKLCESRHLTALLGGSVHQGVALHVRRLGPVALENCLESGTCSVIMLLDQITDPRNVGAILRSAAAFGIDAVVTHLRRSAPESAVMAKAASGGLDYIPYVRVGNLANAIRELQQKDYHVIGLDGSARNSLDTVIHENGVNRLALVLGSEDRGLRQLTRESCNTLASIPLHGPIGSLNVSSAAAVALHSVAAGTRQ